MGEKAPGGNTLYANTWWTPLPPLRSISNILRHPAAKLLSDSAIDRAYIAARIPAGTYYFSVYSAMYLSNNIPHTMQSPIYTAKSSPLYFEAKEGEVLYLGDIEVESNKKTDNIPIYTIADHFQDAKTIITIHYPNIAHKLKRRFVEKTPGQAVLEQKVTKPQADNLLKDVESAK